MRDDAKKSSGRGRGALAPAGAVLLCALAPASTSGAPSSHVTRPDPAAQTTAEGRLGKPLAASECPERWSMSRLRGSTVWVGDSASGRIHVYRLDGTRLRVIDTRLGRDRLTGFAFASDGRLSVLDAYRSQVTRLRAPRT
jgi:hypothetical protein